MKILRRYLVTYFLRNVGLSLMVFVLLFLVFDFFDRIDNIMAEDAGVWITIQYFLYKVPLTVSLMLPVAMMVATLLTIGLLSKNSEITAMRASGVTIWWLANPLLVTGLVMSLCAILINETAVPFAQRRVREIYNIDIRQKDKKGYYSQTDFWWRTKDRFFSVGMFDSRTNALHDISEFEVNQQFDLARRTNAETAEWIDPLLGWSMVGIKEFVISADGKIDEHSYRRLPLPISEQPSDFYDVKTDPYTLSFAELKSFMKKQARNGLSINGYLPYLYEKLASPFLNFIVVLVVLPFALKPARSGSLAASSIAALVIGFSYYAIHSFSIAMGKAEILPALLAAFAANILMLFVGTVLLLGSESPT